MTSYSKHLRLLLAFTAFLLVALVIFNLLIDPYACFGLLGRTRFSHSAAGLGTRIGKGEMIARQDWDVILLGTSRVQGSLNPNHAAFNGLRVYNAGLYGADFPELDQAARLAMKRRTLKRLILCVDLFCFDPDWHGPRDAEQSRLNPHVNPVEYYAANLLGLGATKQSIDTLDYAIHGSSSPDYPLGMTAAHSNPFAGSLDSWVIGGYLQLTLPDGMEKSDRWPLSESRFDALSNLLADASRRGIRVDLVQLPMHAVALEGYFAAGRWPIYERWVGRLTRLVAEHDRSFPNSRVLFWDFCDYNFYTTDPALYKSIWFYDPFHPAVPLGDLVLDRIMNFPAPAGASLGDFGLIMTEANLEPHLARLRHDHQVYYDANPQVMRFHQAIRADLAARNSDE